MSTVAKQLAHNHRITQAQRIAAEISDSSLPPDLRKADRYTLFRGEDLQTELPLASMEFSTQKEYSNQGT